MQQKRRCEFTAVEVPIQLLAIAVSHHIQAGECIAHGIKGGLFHCRTEEQDHRGPFVDMHHDALRDLVSANSVVCGAGFGECRVIIGQTGNGFQKIDIMFARVDKRQCVHDGFDFSNAFCKGVFAHQTYKVEHAVAAEV